MSHASGPRPLVTLTTDFGTRDGYVAQMKGVLLSEGPPGLQLMDLSHDLARQDVMGAALFAEAAYGRFPAGTVHVMVVDPGVGSARHALAIVSGGQHFVGPDNGVFGLCLEHDATAYAVDLARLRRPVSPTFHGRDVFAPAAAALARGEAPGTLGPLVTELAGISMPLAQFEGSRALGEIIHIDRFGNCITNLTAATLAAFGQGDPLEVTCTQPIGPLRGHYAEVAVGGLLALIDSGGRLEIAVREGSAAAELSLVRGARVTVQRAGP